MNLKNQIASLVHKYSDSLFEDISFQVFELQAKNNKVYNQFLSLIGADHKQFSNIEDIPLLPISLFKNNVIKTGDWKEEQVFKSSGTSQKKRSTHYIKDIDWYKNIALSTFEKALGPIDEYIVLALLPSYAENKHSSLICMVEHLIYKSGDQSSQFCNYDFNKLDQLLQSILSTSQKKIVLIGVSYALIDFCETFKFDSDRLKVLFTGGMKGRGTELTFKEVQSRIKNGFPSSMVISEYGMTELCSQAYSDEEGIFSTYGTMKVMYRDITDPLSISVAGKTAQLGVIDLANIDSLSFILTEDLARPSEQKFEVSGRLDMSDVRGCNLLYLS